MNQFQWQLVNRGLRLERLEARFDFREILATYQPSKNFIDNRCTKSVKSWDFSDTRPLQNESTTISATSLGLRLKSQEARLWIGRRQIPLVFCNFFQKKGYKYYWIQCGYFRGFLHTDNDTSVGIWKSYCTLVNILFLYWSRLISATCTSKIVLPPTKAVLTVQVFIRRILFDHATI